MDCAECLVNGEGLPVHNLPDRPRVAVEEVA
jgi:hypothetical protein